MDSPTRPHSVLRFGAFELDEVAGELREDGKACRLPAQPFRVLVLLAERAGELVPRKFSAICGAIAITSEWIAGLISA
jgi:DNA-binding response OmpR family regulator